MTPRRRIIDHALRLLVLAPLLTAPAFVLAGDAEVVRLIDSLTAVGEEGVGFHSTAWAEGFIAIDDEPRFAGGIIGSTQPVISPSLRALVRKGVTALPDLIDHLSDPRETGLKASAMGMWLCEEYDPRDPVPRTYKPGPRQRASAHLGRDNMVGPYTLRVGDLCFVAIGQIVNRKLLAIRYQPSACLVINSPVEKPALAASVGKDWRGLTPDQHKRSLARDATRPGYDEDPGALVRLWYYYPEEGETLALKMLARPLYDDAVVWRFITPRLVNEETPERWRPMIEELARERGSRYTPIIPSMIRWIFWRTDFGEDPPFLKERAVAAKILARLYSNDDEKDPPFINAVGPGALSELIEATASFPSRRVDDVVHRIYVTMKREEFSTRYDFDRLSEACVRRLIGKRYPDVILPYCRLRMEEIRYEAEGIVRDAISWMAGALPLWVLGTDVEEPDAEGAF